MVVFAQDSYLDAEMSPPTGDFKAICAEIYGKLWDFFRGLEVEDPFEHVAGHFRSSWRTVVHPSSELIDVGTIFSEGPYW